MNQHNKPQWRPLASLPQGNGGFACGMAGGHLLMIGGTTWDAEVKHWLKKVWDYDPSADRWTARADLDVPLAYSAFGQVNGGVCMAGGIHDQMPQKNILLFKADGKPQTLAQLPHGLVLSGSAGSGDALYIVGGTPTGDPAAQTDEFFRIDAKTGRIDRLQKYPGGPLIMPTVAAQGDHVFVFAGAKYDPKTRSVANIDQAFVYTISKGEWRPIRSYPAARRGVSACALDDQWILLAGGYGRLKPDQTGEGMSADLFLYSIAEDRYIPLPPLPYAAMAPMLVRDGPTLYLGGGEDRPRHRSDHFYSRPWREWIPQP